MQNLFKGGRQGVKSPLQVIMFVSVILTDGADQAWSSVVPRFEFVFEYGSGTDIFFCDDVHAVHVL